VFAINFAHQRRLEAMLLELDWIGSLRQALFLRDFEPESLLDVAQARLLVLRTLGTQGGGSYGQRGNGGSEGATELARIGLDRLIELGEIGHILDLQRRFGALPLMSTGFVSLYTQGLTELADGDAGMGDGSYAQASMKLGQALDADDLERYREHAGDAALKMAYCQMRLGKPGEAARILEANAAFMIDDAKIEESAWLMILAHDSAVQSGQEQLSDRLSELIGEYIRSYPSTERANTLVVRYAMTPQLGSYDTIKALLIEDPADPLAMIARRKLIQLLYKNPELIEGVSTDSGDTLYLGILEHAEWLWEHEPSEVVNLHEGRERLAVYRIVLATGMGIQPTDLGIMERAIEQGERLIESMPGLDGSASEIAFRRIQLWLIQGRIDQAGELVLSGTVMDESVTRSALFMVFDAAYSRFSNTQSVPNAQSVVRYGRRILDDWRELNEDTLDHQHSSITEYISEAALYLADQTRDDTMRAYSLALCHEVFEKGSPTTSGLIRTAIVSEVLDETDLPLQCWLRLVSRLESTDIRWHRARYESFRLLHASDPERAKTAYQQYLVLYPEGSPEPWGNLIRDVFVDEVGGTP
jgi:hypothetical protein